MADFRYGLNCIVARVKSSQELDLKFVLNRKQYTVAYSEQKHFDGGRNLSQLLLASDALKASIWNVPSGPPGSKTRSWYVTDIWNPNISGMEKSRLPEPTISIVCKISHILGKNFFICELGKHLTRDIIVLPRSLLHYVVKGIQPDIGDYLLVFALLVCEVLDGCKISRFVPLWAHWDGSNCDQASTAHLNIVERGPEKSTLLIPHQIPCMWGVVQDVSKKSMKVYVPCIDLSVTVPKNAVYQCDSEILQEDWVQLWLTPQMKETKHFSKVANWTCSNCCWFGRAKKRYEAYLQQRLNGHYVKHSSQSLVGSGAAIPAAPIPTAKGNVPKPTQQQTPSTSAPDPAVEIGVGKVKEVKERSGVLACKKAGCKREHVFHLGLMTIYGVKMSSIKSANLKDLVEKGSELQYRMNRSNHQLKAVWIGPEFPSYKNMNFLPQFNSWLAKRKLSGAVVQEMMKGILESYEAANASDEAKAKAEASNAPKQVTSADGKGASVKKDAVVMEKGAKVPQRGSGDGRDDVGSAGLEEGKYSKEEEDELERLWWSEDSEESEDDLVPVLSPSGALLPSNSDDSDKQSEMEEGEGSENLMVVDEARQSLENGDDQLCVGMPSEQSQMPTGGSQPTESGGQELYEGKSNKTWLLMVVLAKLSKFLVDKGKSESVADACEVSADFVACLEKELEESNYNEIAVTRPLTHSVGVQTEASTLITPAQALLISQILKLQGEQGN